MEVVKLGTVPAPDGRANPVFVLLFVQLYSVPPTIEPESIMALLLYPEQNVAEGTGFTTGVGLTIILNSRGVPSQLFEIGVTFKEAVMGIPEELVVIKVPILPEPVNPIPINELSFVQLYIVFPTGDPVNTMEVLSPLQITCEPDGITVTVGVGLMVN